MGRVKPGKKAPGPDGIQGVVWINCGDSIKKYLVETYNTYLRSGVFPKDWKVAKLILLQNPGRPLDFPAAYRPTCLLDEVGKVLERILVRRIWDHLRTERPNISEFQFGFRPDMSTVDATRKVRSITNAFTEEGKLSLAISIDITNAFNTITWDAVKLALVEYNILEYLQRILYSYLSDRYQFIAANGSMKNKKMTCIPQGSVLGPMLWDLAYDYILKMDLTNDIHLVCYADDTPILIGGHTWFSIKYKPERMLASISQRLRRLGLRAAPTKTEILIFTIRGKEQPPEDYKIRWSEREIQTKKQFIYFGLIISHNWKWNVHFEALMPKAIKVGASLGRLMLNVGGPGLRARKLYLNVAHSILLCRSGVG